MMFSQNEIGVGIDADSIIFKACYRKQVILNGISMINIEEAYMEFCHEILKIEYQVKKLMNMERKDKLRIVIVLSPKRTFRNIIADTYKSKRKPTTIQGIKQLKQMVMSRLKSLAFTVKYMEADDIVIYLAKNYGYFVSAIDKDVVMASPTHCWHYNKREWHYPSNEEDVEKWYWKQAMMGDTVDSIKGAPGYGEVRADEHVQIHGFDWNAYAEKFDTEDDALMSMRLVRMDQLYKKGNEWKIRLWTPEKSEWIQW